MYLALLSCQVLCVSEGKKKLSTGTAWHPFSSTLVLRFIKHDCFTLNTQYPFTTACSVLQTSLYISSVLKGPHYYGKGAGFIFGKLATLGTKRLPAHWANGCVCSKGMAACATGNRVQLTVPLWLCPLRNFSSDTELGIRSTSPVRRSPNKKRPYELLIVMAPLFLAQHPFKIQIPFKSSRLCWTLSCGSLSTAALQVNESNGCSRGRNHLEAPWCPLRSLLSTCCSPVIL